MSRDTLFKQERLLISRYGFHTEAFVLSLEYIAKSFSVASKFWYLLRKLLKYLSYHRCGIIKAPMKVIIIFPDLLWASVHW